MPSIFYACALVGSLLAAGSRAGPVVVREVDTFPTLQERGFAPITLGNYSLVTSREKDVLFNIGASKSLASGLSDSASLELECVDCRTWGSALITTTGVNKDESAIGNIISFFRNPVDSIVNAFDLEVKIDFVDVGGHFEFELIASDTVSYTYTIFNSETPAGVAISSDVKIGLVLSIELVFSLTAQIDLEAGFEFAFPEGAFVTVDPLEGKIIDHGFTGGDANSLPILCTSGSATFKAALRINAQAGTTVSVFGTGFDFSLGVYADLIEYVATLNSTPICELEITELIDVNVGAFAHAVAEIDYHSLGVSPAVVTTLLNIPLPSLCVTRPHESSLPAFATGIALSVYSTTVSSLPSKTATPSYATTTSSKGGIFFQSSTTSSGAAATSYSNSTLAIKTGSSNATSTSVSAASTYALKTGSSNATSTSVLAASTYTLKTSSSNATSTSVPVASTYALKTISSNATSASAPSTPTYVLKTGSSSVTSTLVPATSSYVLKTGSSNATSTITSAAALITSTVWTTDYITVTTCSSTVLHCPASAASEVILTSTSILYTTICPYGAVLPTTLPSYLNASQSTSVQVVLHTELVSPLPLTPCTENAVSTVYVPTFVNPTYTMPTATSFPVAYPNWTTNLNLGTAAAVEKVVATPSPVVNNVPNAASNGTVVGTAKTTPTSVSFTGAAGRQSMPYLLVSLAGIGLLALP